MTMEKTLSFLVLFAPPPFDFAASVTPSPVATPSLFRFCHSVFVQRKNLSPKKKKERERERETRERENVLNRRLSSLFPLVFTLSTPVSSLFLLLRPLPFLITMSGAVTRRPAAAAAKAPRE